MPTTSTWTERMKRAVNRRRTELVARASAKALDALEAVEKIEGALKEMRERAAEKLKDSVRARRTEETASQPMESERVRARKVAPSATAAKRVRKPDGFKVKRGQKHNA